MNGVASAGDLVCNFEHLRRSDGPLVGGRTRPSAR